MRVDPRIQELVRQHLPRGLTATGGIKTLSTQQLRQFGYDVPDNWTFSFGARAGVGSLSDGTRDVVERWAPRIAIGAGALAGAGALGLVPGIGGVGGGAATGTAAATGVGAETAVGTGAAKVAGSTSLLKQLAPYLLQFGGSALSGMFGDEGGGSYKAEPYLDGSGNPIAPNTLDQLQKALGALGPVFTERLRRGIQLPSAFAQQPPVFAGGGMPMPIGVTGVDPALNDPSMLSLPGFEIDDSLFTSGNAADGNQGQSGRQPGPNAEYTGRYAIPRPEGQPPDRSRPFGPTGSPGPGQAVRRNALADESGGDDSSEALAALKLMGLA